MLIDSDWCWLILTESDWFWLRDARCQRVTQVRADPGPFDLCLAAFDSHNYQYQLGEAKKTHNIFIFPQKKTLLVIRLKALLLLVTPDGLKRETIFWNRWPRTWRLKLYVDLKHTKAWKWLKISAVLFASLMQVFLIVPWRYATGGQISCGTHVKHRLSGGLELGPCRKGSLGRVGNSWKECGKRIVNSGDLWKQLKRVHRPTLLSQVSRPN